MTFDLYGTAAPAKQRVTTLEALAAAEWTQLPDLSWQLVWNDHTDYADGEGDCHGGSGIWSCHLYRDDGDWIYDFEHCCRGGPQNTNGLDLDAAVPAEVAKVAAKKALRHWIKEWTYAVDEQRADGDDE